MNKDDLIHQVAERTGLEKKAAAKAVDAVTSAISDALAARDDVKLVGFGTFSASARAARAGRNPATGAKLKIAATTVARFSPSAILKAAVHSGKKAKKVTSPKR